MRETRRIRRPSVLRARLAAPVAALAAAALTLGLAPAGAAPAAAPPEDRVTITSTRAGDRPGALAAYLRLMTIPSVDGGYLPTEFAPPQADDDRACPPLRCRDHTVPIPRSVKVTSSTVRVILPRGYAKAKKQRYPVVYLYNGARSPYSRWSIATELTRLTRDLEAIFVMPEGGIGDEAGMFSDWADGSFDWETFHTDLLIKWVDRKFRTRKDARGTVGASMGSLGALIYPARHPGLFQSALSISGLTDTNFMVGNILPPEIATSLGISPPDLTRVWGNPVLHQDVWQAHNPVSLAPRLKGVQLLIAAGTGSADATSTTGEPLHSGYTEQLMWTGHRTFLAALTAADVPYDAWVRQGGVHNWPWFDAPLKWGLPKMVRELRSRS